MPAARAQESEAMREDRRDDARHHAFVNLIEQSGKDKLHLLPEALCSYTKLPIGGAGSGSAE